MSEAEPQLDPEVVAIVREIVAQPGSTLFSVPTRATPRAFELRDQAVLSSEPFLRRSERYLLQVHRDALGAAMLAACKAKLMEVPATESMLHPIDAERLGDWRARSRRLREAHRWEAEREDVDTLSEALEHGSVSAASLARIALRLDPGDGARICLALGQDEEGDREGAIETLRHVLGHGARHGDAAYAHYNLGFFHYGARDLPKAQDHYRSASELDPEFMGFVGCWFSTSLLLGDREDALAAARLLRQSQALDLFVEMSRSSVKKGVSRPTKEGEALWNAIREKVPAEARRIAHVFW